MNRTFLKLVSIQKFYMFYIGTIRPITKEKTWSGSVKNGVFAIRIQKDRALTENKNKNCPSLGYRYVQRPNLP